MRHALSVLLAGALCAAATAAGAQTQRSPSSPACSRLPAWRRCASPTATTSARARAPCIRSAYGPQIATCGRVQNVLNWELSGAPCDPPPGATDRSAPAFVTGRGVTLRPPVAYSPHAHHGSCHAMLIRRGRGWDMPESRLTPESVWLDRRRLIAGAGAMAAFGAPGPAAAQWFRRQAGPDAQARPDRRSLSGQDQRHLHAGGHGPARDRGGGLGRLQQLLRVRHLQDDLARGSGQADPALGHQGRGAGGEALRDRRRRPDPPHAAGGALLPLPLREGWAMAVPWTASHDGAAARHREADRGREVRPLRHLQQSADRAGQRQTWYPWPYQEACTIAEARKRPRLRGDRHLRQAAAQPVRRADPHPVSVEIRLQVRQGDQPRRLQRRAAQRPSGRRCSRRSTASGPM